MDTHKQLSPAELQTIRSAIDDDDVPALAKAIKLLTDINQTPYTLVYDSDYDQVWLPFVKQWQEDLLALFSVIISVFSVIVSVR